MKLRTFKKKIFKLQIRTFFLISTMLILGFLGSCTVKPAVVEGSQINKAESLSMGKTLYENSCAKCHDLPSPADHSARDWVGIMNRMAPLGKLNEEQHDLVYNYIVSEKK